MKKKLILFLLPLLVLGSTNLFGQVIIYSEDFDGPPTWTPNTDLTAEDANPNVWYVSCEEEGVGEGFCGLPCGPGNQTLHVGADALGGGDIGAAYLETGFDATGTNRRAESADISTIGETDLTLNFDMIGKGNDTDFCELFYSIDGGVTWISLDAPLVELCCGGIVCTGLDQGLWAERSYALPVTCEGIANLRISFVWQNIDDGVATDPSFAVDNITIERPVIVVDGGPTALFYPEDTVICQGESLTYTDLSLTDDVITDWNWDFEGGAPGSATTAGPHVVTYTVPGVYTTSLTVTDGIGEHDTSFTVTVLDGPYAGESTSLDLCSNEILDLNTLIPGADAGGTWVETTIPASGSFTALTGEFDPTGLTAGDIYTFEYETLAGVLPCDGTDISVITITIIDCEDLEASFTTTTTICQGDCINFVDESTGTGITGYAWTFSDPDIGGPLTGMDPGSVCFPNAGDIDVTLTITDGTDFDDTTITITVNPLPNIVPVATATTICVGGDVTLTGTGGVSYTWSGGVIDGVSFTLDETTTFTVTGTNEFDCENTAEITIIVIECEPLIAGFELDNIICVGDCITLTDTSQGDPIEWLWDFGDAADPATSTEQNPVVCFDTSGIFDIQLTVTNIIDETSSTSNSITVFVSPTVDAELDTIIDLGGQASLVAAGSLPEGEYYWSPDDYLSCENCNITTASPPSDMEYIVTFTDVNGCWATDTVQVYVNFIEAVGVPDAFSPNGDGTNDVLYVRGFGLETIIFSIYNKYGEKVFESRTQDIGWDGTFKGRDENPGVFTWVLEYQFINGNSDRKKGNTTLIR